jgi:hypothetical protein
MVLPQRDLTDLLILTKEQGDLKMSLLLII